MSILANRLKYTEVAVERKEVVMWTFDGEEWTEEGGAQSNERKPEASLPPRWDETMPELQVVEHIPSTTTRINYVPLPLP
jgi:hypothetical protein